MEKEEAQENDQNKISPDTEYSQVTWLITNTPWDLGRKGWGVCVCVVVHLPGKDDQARGKEPSAQSRPSKVVVCVTHLQGPGVPLSTYFLSIKFNYVENALLRL
jgi:hypothetical protein